MHGSGSLSPAAVSYIVCGCGSLSPARPNVWARTEQELDMGGTISVKFVSADQLLSESCFTEASKVCGVDRGSKGCLINKAPPEHIVVSPLGVKFAQGFVATWTRLRRCFMVVMFALLLFFIPRFGEFLSQRSNKLRSKENCENCCNHGGLLVMLFNAFTSVAETVLGAWGVGVWLHACALRAHGLRGVESNGCKFGLVFQVGSHRGNQHCGSDCWALS